MRSFEVAIVGSGFAGSLLARVLAVLGYDVVLLERGTHPRFAIGESSTPLANLSLERIGVRYGLPDCYQLATHWLRADVDHHFVRQAIATGVDYREGVNLTSAETASDSVLVNGSRDGR